MGMVISKLFDSEIRIDADGGTYIFLDMVDIAAYGLNISFFTEYAGQPGLHINIRKGIAALLGKSKGKYHAAFTLFSTPDGKVSPVGALRLMECLDHVNAEYRDGTFYWLPHAHSMYKGTNIHFSASKVIRYLAWLKLGQPPIYMYGFLLDNGHFTSCDAEGEPSIVEQYYEQLVGDTSIVEEVQLSTGEKIGFIAPDVKKAFSVYHDLKYISDDLYIGAIAIKDTL